MRDLRTARALVALCSPSLVHGEEIRSAVVISLVSKELSWNTNFGSNDANGALSGLPDVRKVNVLELQIGNRIVRARARLPAGVEMMAGVRST